MEQGLCTYKDYQKVTLQEMPERARVGQLPRSVEILLEYDLVDRVKPGDRVQVVGLYRAEANELNGIVNTIFKTQLMGNNISVIGKEVGSIKLTAIDVSNIKDIASHENVLQMLSSSLCPSIFGHEFVKMALILQLLGGCERNLENGTHLRGDINVMFVGDPSTAKSQLLRSILDIAPLAISTTGKGSSGVGLTAAVSMDPETGEKRLEAGAMVLADRGIVCIDEFDKMGENDRTAIHEVMEQQTVTIAKAGIHASLNARCSVVAAANPIYGQYDKSRRPQENIGLPDSLLSRFDLLFIVLDQLDPTIDRRLSEHVVRNHQYRRPGTVMEPESLRAGSLISLEDHKESEDTPVWIRGGSNSSNSSSTCADGTQHSNDILSKEFLRKYIFYSKAQRPPTLTDEAMQIISASYAAMRSKSGMKNLPVTARTLETIIRLSTASAKTRLSRIVEAQDVECATELVNYVLFHEIGEQLQAVDSVMGNGQSQSNKRGVNQMEEEDERDGEGEENEAGGGQDGSPMRSPSARRRRRNNNNGTPSTLNSPPILNEKTQNSQNIAESEDYIFSSQYSQSLKSNSNSNSNSNSDRVKTVMDVVVKLTSEADTIYIDDIMLSLGEIRGIIFVFEEEEVLDVLSIMENNNKIMLDRADRSVMRI